MICIYHNRDLDGWASGAIVKKWFEDMKDSPDNVGKGELTMMGYDYGQPILWDSIPKNEKVIMVDVSFKMEDMVRLANHSGGRMTWVDHHISAINDYKKFKEEVMSGRGNENFLNPILENGISACEGTWKFLFPDEDIPPAILLLGEYDTWRNQDTLRWENKILPFQFGMRTVCNSVETFPTEILRDTNGADEFIFRTTDGGRLILRYQAMLNESLCKKASFEYEFEGLRAICLNGGGFNSDVFKSVYDEAKHDIMMPFQFDGKQWVISLYTTKENIDCSALAKLKGGGGHKAASGFQVKNIHEIFPNLL